MNDAPRPDPVAIPLPRKPTSEVVERVARAICLQASRDDGYDVASTMPSIEQGMWRNYIRQARAAIAALREPTEAMLAANLDGIREAEGFEARLTALDTWRAMIDAALADDQR